MANLATSLSTAMALFRRSLAPGTSPRPMRALIRDKAADTACYDRMSKRVTDGIHPKLRRTRPFGQAFASMPADSIQRAHRDRRWSRIVCLLI